MATTKTLSQKSIKGAIRIIYDFAKLRVLMTVVGGRTVHLVPSLAKEIGMQPTGAQVTLEGGPAAGW